MDNNTQKCTHTHTEIQWHCLDQVYGNAQCALRYGATTDDVLEQIQQAFDFHQEHCGEDGWIIGPDTDVPNDPIG